MRLADSRSASVAGALGPGLASEADGRGLVRQDGKVAERFGEQRRLTALDATSEAALATRAGEQGLCKLRQLIETPC